MVEIAPHVFANREIAELPRRRGGLSCLPSFEWQGWWPAPCSQWDPADGHSPITKSDRPDARFKNITRSPWWTDGEPIIDRCVAGVHLTSTWTDRWIGSGTSADVRKRALAYEELVARSRPVDKKGNPRPQWSNKAEHRPGLEQDEMRRRYARRLAAAGRSYNDGLRSHLKATCGPDFKPYTPGTNEGLYWRLPHSALLLALILPYQPAWFIVAVFALPPHIELSDPDPSFRPDPAFADDRGPTDWRLSKLGEPFGYQGRALGLLPPEPGGNEAGHGTAISWFAISEYPPEFIVPFIAPFSIILVGELLQPLELPPRWHACFVGLYDEITGLPKGNREVVESEVLSDDAIAGSRNRDGEDKRRGKKRQPKLPDWPEELDLIKRAQAGDEGARNRILLNYQRKAAKIAKRFGTRLIPVRELVIVALIGCEDDSGKVTNGLLHALQKFDPENGGRFSSFATAAMEHAIYQYLERNPRQLSLNSNVSPDEEEDTWIERVEDETEDVEESEAETECRIAALACLTERELLMLQASHIEGKTLKEIAQQWGISSSRVWRVIQAATKKARMEINTQKKSCSGGKKSPLPGISL